MQKIRKGDKVQVIRGEDRPQTTDDQGQASGEVLEVNTKDGTCKVAGCNLVWKHKKGDGAENPGGRTQEEAWIKLSNVMLFNEAAGRAERVTFKNVEGKRVRWWAKSDSAVDA
ncbi:MAG: 50S ribosomal protein L24 [Planctomycetes bacterium]|nr:50S ribosomal protein L24 [Planctomycetota bacterium]